MNTIISSVDYDTLPAAMMPAFKRWNRVDFCDDDELIIEVLQQAIEQFERNSEITVFKSTIILEPEDADWRDGILPLRVTPVNTLAVTQFDEAVPHSDLTWLGDNSGYRAAVAASATNGFQLFAKGIHGVRLYYLAGSSTTGVSITIESGYESTTLKPEIRGTVMQIAAHLYEYREILMPNNRDESPMWLRDIMAGFWLPGL